jgi:hypothetical protein
MVLAVSANRFVIPPGRSSTPTRGAKTDRVHPTIARHVLKGNRNLLG